VSTHPLGLSICGFALAICVVPRCRAPQLEESETFFSHWPGVLVRSSEIWMICVRMNAPPSSLQKCHCRPGGGARAVLRADLSFRTTLAVRLIPSCEDLWRDLLVFRGRDSTHTPFGHDGVYSNPVIVVNQKGAGEIVCARVWAVVMSRRKILGLLLAWPSAHDCGSMIFVAMETDVCVGGCLGCRFVSISQSHATRGKNCLAAHDIELMDALVSKSRHCLCHPKPHRLCAQVALSIAQARHHSFCSSDNKHLPRLNQAYMRD
jgi:hypothetical protein